MQSEINRSYPILLEIGTATSITGIILLPNRQHDNLGTGPRSGFEFLDHITLICYDFGLHVQASASHLTFCHLGPGRVKAQVLAFAWSIHVFRHPEACAAETIRQVAAGAWCTFQNRKTVSVTHTVSQRAILANLILHKLKFSLFLLTRKHSWSTLLSFGNGVSVFVVQD